MKAESCQEGLCIKAFTRVETYCAPNCTLLPGTPSSNPGCSSSPLLNPGSMKDTDGSVPFCTSVKYSDTGTILLGYLLAVANMLMVLSWTGGVA